MRAKKDSSENEKQDNFVDQCKSIIAVSRCLYSVGEQIFISSITAMQDAVTKLDRCVVEIKIKAEFEDRQGWTHDEYCCNNVAITTQY